MTMVTMVYCGQCENGQYAYAENEFTLCVSMNSGNELVKLVEYPVNSKFITIMVSCCQPGINMSMSKNVCNVKNT